MALKDITKETPSGHYDICIVGSGPAGLTLANELASSGKRIAVIESGEVGKTPYADALREVKNTGEIFIRPSSRERVLGGASTTWSSLSAPLDQIDLENRPYLSHSTGWPLTLSDLKPYYRRTTQYGFPSLESFDGSWLAEARDAGDFAFSSSRILEKTFIAKDPPWNFGQKLHSIFNAHNVDLYLNATVTSLSSKKDTQQTYVTSADIRTPNNDARKISAKMFVLATGGLENARLLLLSRNTNPHGLGNNHDQVGRYLMNHPKGNFGIIKLTKPVKNLPHLFGYLRDGWSGYAGIRLQDDSERSLKVLNSYLRFEPIFSWTDSQGITALIIIVKKAKRFLNWWKQKQKNIVQLRDWNETGDEVNEKRGFNQKINWLSSVWTIITDMPAIFSYIYYRLNNKKELLVKTVRLRNFMEMEPIPENRLTLSDKLDANGNALPSVALNTSTLDRRSLIELHRLFGEEIEKNKIGTLESDLEKVRPWPINAEASHHLGGTRMGIDPLTSVVNSDLRVHGVENLYICGGSVFPTSGCANPTYTICALAIRLADFIKKEIQTLET